MLGALLFLGAGCHRDKGHRFPSTPNPPAKPAPDITGVNPTQGPLAGGNTVTILGDDFLDPSDVFFADRSATLVTFESASSLRVVVPAGSAAGKVDVKVRTAGGEDVLPQGYEYLSDVEPFPEIASIEPNVGPLAGGNTVTILGDNFMQPTVVYFGSAPGMSVSVTSEQRLTVVAPAGAQVGFVDVKVQTAAGDFVEANGYRYVLPEIATITPQRGPVAGGTPIAITGNWFTTVPDTAVLLGGRSVNVTSVTLTTIEGTTPSAQRPGTVDLEVTNSYGSATLSGAFTYETEVGPPTIESIDPTSGPARGGTTVVATGSGFSATGLEVTLCGVRLSSVEVVDDRTLQGKTPPGEIDAICDLVVRTDLGTATLPGAFTYVCDFPLVAITFPLGGITTAEQITIRGTASDPDGIASVKINGTSVQTTDQYAHFQLLVPLALGENTFTVSAEDALGCGAPNAATIRIIRLAVEPVDGPIGVTFTPAGEIVYSDHVQRAIFAIDPVSGARRTIKQPVPAWDIDRTGDFFDFCYQTQLWQIPVTGGSVVKLGQVPYAVFRALARENATSVLCTSDSHGSVYRFHLDRNEVSVLSSEDVGSGPALVRPHGIAVQGDGQIIVSDFSEGYILRIDPATGARAILSGGGVGQGPELRMPGPLAFLDAGTLVVASNDPNVNLYRVDVATGNRIVLSSAKRGKGPAPNLAIDLALHPAFDVDITADGEVILSDPGTPALFRIDPETGDRTTIVTGAYGAGPKLNRPQGIAIENGSLLVVERNKGELYRINFSNSNRSLVSGEGMGSGPFVSFAAGVAACSGAAYIAGRESADIIRVDLATGARALFSGGAAGSGPALGAPVAVACENDQALLVADLGASAVVRVALGSGDRTVLSGPGVGTGPALNDISGIAKSGTRVVVTNSQGTILEIDPATGNRRQVGLTDLTHGPLVGIAAAETGSFVVAAQRAVFFLGAEGTQLQLISNANQGHGPNIIRGVGIVADPSGRIFVPDYTRAAVFQVQRESGDRVLFSR